MKKGANIGLAGLLVGLGVAIFAKAVIKVGFSQLTLEHIMGPSLILVGLLRLRLEHIMNKGYGDRKEGDDGGH